MKDTLQETVPADVMTNAVQRQQRLLASQVLQEEESTVLGRTQRFGEYVHLLTQNNGPAATERLHTLTGEFFIPRSASEAIQIIDAGGIQYGIS